MMTQRVVWVLACEFLCDGHCFLQRHQPVSRSVQAQFTIRFPQNHALVQQGIDHIRAHRCMSRRSVPFNHIEGLLNGIERLVQMPDLPLEIRQHKIDMPFRRSPRCNLLGEFQSPFTIPFCLLKPPLVLIFHGCIRIPVNRSGKFFRSEVAEIHKLLHLSNRVIGLHQGLFWMALRMGQRHAIVRDRCRKTASNPVSWIPGQHLLDESLGVVQTCFRVRKLPEVRRSRIALHMRDLDVSGSDVERQILVTRGLASESIQILQGVRNNLAPDLGRTGEPSDLLVKIDKFVGQLARFKEAFLCQGALSVGNIEARGKAGDHQQRESRRPPSPRPDCGVQICRSDS